MLKTLAAAAAVIGLAWTQGGAQEKGKPSEKEHGEKWLYADLLRHFNGCEPFKSARDKLAKTPGKFPGTMYFYEDDGSAGRGVGARARNDMLGPELWDGFGVEQLKDRAAAKERVTFLQDQRNEAGAFSWGKYVFRGPDDELKRVKKLLPP